MKRIPLALIATAIVVIGTATPSQSTENYPGNFNPHAALNTSQVVSK